MALACALVGCGFSARLDGTQASDAAPTDDAAVDAPAPDAAVGRDAMMAGMLVAPSVADVYLRTSVAPDQNTNNLDYMIVDGDLIATPILRFDLTAIPTTALVTAATLVIYDDGDAGEAVSIYQLLESWDEATVTSNQRATGMPWTGAGATPPSRGTTPIGTFTPSTASVSYMVPLTTSIVQSWVTSPATNFGIAIVTTANDGARFGSREKSDPAQRPTLRVDYTN